MELTPQTLHAVEFREARRGGYNTRDVDDFIERVAGGVGQLNERVREAQARADAAESRLIEVQREAEELRRRPAAVAEVSETDETLRRTLVLAQRTADATVKEAKEEANRVLSEAREEAARTRAEAEAEARRGAEEARTAAQNEVETLLDNRDKLKSDLDALRGRLEEQRQQLRAGIGELQRVLDDPASLKPVGPVKLAEVKRPTPIERPEPPPAEPTGVGAPAPQAGNGHDAPESPPLFAPGQVAALPEPETGPPTQPVPFAVGGDARGPWLPSELRPQGDEPLGPAPAPPDNGAPAAAPDPASRPSEWGRAVFEPDNAEGESSRFGRRR